MSPKSKISKENLKFKPTQINTEKLNQNLNNLRKKFVLRGKTLKNSKIVLTPNKRMMKVLRKEQKGKRKRKKPMKSTKDTG